MTKFFSFVRSAVTLALLWSLIGVFGYVIFSTINATADAKLEMADTALKRFDHKAATRPYGLPKAEERHIAASVSKFATIPGTVDLAFDRSGNGFILTELGRIFRSTPTGEVDELPYLSLRRETTTLDIDFSAIALHPGFLDPESRGHGRFYVIEPEQAGTRPADFRPAHGKRIEHHQDVLVEYHTMDPAARVFSGSRREVMRLSQPGAAHNMSSLSFDRSGRLFIATGDGAAGNNGEHFASRNAMELDNVFGKVLRIDPLGSNSTNGQYGIPRRNPFRFLDEALPEIYAYGLRSPRHVNFDIFRDQLCITDSGKDGIDEVNLSTTGGEHFGWDLCEGSFFYPPARGERPESGVAQPTVEMAKIETGALVGSLHYYGHRFPELNQRLIVASESGELFASRAGESPTRILLDNHAALTRDGIRTIRSGADGELFVVSEMGNIFQINKRAASTSNSDRPGRRMIAMLSF